MDKTKLNFKEKWGQLNPLVKWVVPTVPIALLILGVLYWASPDEYEDLYSGLTDSDSVEVQQYLSSKNIPFKTAEEGQTIQIDGDVSLVKSELSSMNLPSNPEQTGLDRFNELSIGSTKYDKEVQYQSRLQEELETAITHAFDDIEQARVTLPKIEKQPIYKDEVTETKISVALKPKSNSEITPENVNAIQLFVASSIQSVVPENVEVVDSQMRVLSGSSEGSGTFSSSNSLEITNKVKGQIEEDLEKVLSEVYGRVNIVASVDINFDEIVQNIETYDPEGTLLSGETLNESEGSSEGEVDGIVGTDENGEVPGYEIENLDEEDVSYLKDKEHLIENFAVGKTVEKIIHHPELRNTNVAVWVNDELEQIEIEELEEMIAISAGMTGEAERDANNKAVYDNGSVKVAQLEFAEGNEDIFDEEQEQGDKEGLEIPWWLWAIAAASVLLIIIIIVIVLVRKSKKEDEEKIDDNPVIVEIEDEEKEVDNKDDEVVEEENVEGENEEKFNFEWTEEQKSMRELTNEVTKKFPKETANVIKKLLKK